MKIRNVLLVSGGVVVLAYAAFLLSGPFRAGEDSPITVSDGSIDFSRQWYKLKGFKHDTRRHHHVKDSKYAPVALVVGTCPLSGLPASGTWYDLSKAKVWTLSLNDGTTLTHDDGADHERVDISLNEDPSVSDIFSTLTLTDPLHLTSAYLTLDGAQGPQLCPQTGCHIEICYEAQQ